MEDPMEVEGGVAVDEKIRRLFAAVRNDPRRGKDPNTRAALRTDAPVRQVNHGNAEAAVGVGGVPLSHLPAILQSRSLVVLNDYVDTQQSECLNEEAMRTWTGILMPQSQRYLESDADPQLLLSLHFRKPVRLAALLFRAPMGGQAPKKIKIFVNEPHLDFNEAERLSAAHEMELTEEMLVDPGENGELAKRQYILLDYTKFSRVSQLTVFVETNQDDGFPTTIIDSLLIIGQLFSR